MPIETRRKPRGGYQIGLPGGPYPEVWEQGRRQATMTPDTFMNRVLMSGETLPDTAGLRTGPLPGQMPERLAQSPVSYPSPEKIVAPGPSGEVTPVTLEGITANRFGYADTPYTRMFGMSDWGGSELGDIIHRSVVGWKKQAIIKELTKVMGDESKANRFYELVQKKDAETAEMEFPEYSGVGIIRKPMPIKSWR